MTFLQGSYIVLWVLYVVSLILYLRERRRSYRMKEALNKLYGRYGKDGDQP